MDRPEAELRAGALRLPSVLMQGITHIAPAVGLLLSLPFIAPRAGVTTPLAFTISFGIILLLVLRRTGREGWILKAGQVAYERKEVEPAVAEVPGAKEARS